MKPFLCCFLLAFATLVLGACTPNQRADRGGYYGPFGGRASTMSELELRSWQVRSAGTGTTIQYQP